MFGSLLQQLMRGGGEDAALPATASFSPTSVMPIQPQPMPATASFSPASVVPQPMQPQPMQPQPMQQQPQPIQPVQPMQPQPMSIFDLIRAPQQAQFNVQQAQGTRPKNFRPAQIGMSNVPMASVFNLLGAGRQSASPFTVTPSSGTRPKNFRPAQISMNAPSPAGPAAMMQMLALMRGGFGASPFAPFGQGQG
jgi:hypothetical protein